MVGRQAFFISGVRSFNSVRLLLSMLGLCVILLSQSMLGAGGDAGSVSLRVAMLLYRVCGSFTLLGSSVYKFTTITSLSAVLG